MDYNYIPIEKSKKRIGKVIDFLLYRNQYVFIKKSHVFVGEHESKFVCRRCLSSYSSQNVSMKHKHRCEEKEKRSIQTSNQSDLYWKKRIHEKPFYLRTFADFESYTEIDNSNKGDEAKNIYERNPVCIVYYSVWIK